MNKSKEELLAQVERHIAIREARDPNPGGISELPVWANPEAKRKVRQMIRHALTLDAQKPPPEGDGSSPGNDQAATGT